MPSTGSPLGKTNAPKQRGSVTQVARGVPECLVAVRSTKNSTIQGVWKDICRGEIFCVYDSGFCSAETQTCPPSFHSLLHFIPQAQMETSIWTWIPAGSSLKCCVVWVRFPDTLGWYPLRQTSDFMALQPLHPTSPSIIDSLSTAGTSGTICKIPVHSKLIPDLKVSLEQDLSSC